MKEVKAKKSLGQNFLKDERVLYEISNLCDATNNDLILEIGPGMGALTKYLVKKEAKVLAYEIDERMRPYLEKYDNLLVRYGDFLKTDFNELENLEYNKLYVVANIPYYITTPIIEHLLKNNIVPDKMILLVQKEVALRFCALPSNHDYGYFTVYLNHYFNVKKVRDVPSKCFSPMPKVTSSVVVFDKKDKLTEIPLEKFFSFIKMCFKQKRKTLKNNLSIYDENALIRAVEKMGYSKDVRAECISYEHFCELYKILN